MKGKKDFFEGMESKRVMISRRQEEKQMKEERKLQERARCRRSKQAKRQKSRRKKKRSQDSKQEKQTQSKQVAQEEWELQRLRGRLLRFWATFLSLQKATLVLPRKVWKMLSWHFRRMFAVFWCVPKAIHNTVICSVFAFGMENVLLG